jgi:hypothetical protein
MAGPALIDPPRINTTRMIANSSTTDSEMATTDHTLRSVRSPGPEVQPLTPPPEPSCHQPGFRMRRVTHRRPRACRARTPAPPRRGPTAGLRTAIRECTRTGPSTEIQRDRCHVHTTCSQVIRIVVTGTSKTL